MEDNIYLKLKKSSWENFFRVMNSRKKPIELVGGSSLGNFFAALQHLECQFKEPYFLNIFEKIKNFKKSRDEDNCIYCNKPLTRIKYDGYGTKQSYCEQGDIFQPNNEHDILTKIFELIKDE